MTQGFARDRKRESLHDLCHYELEAQGHIDEEEFNATGPLQITVVRGDRLITSLAADTDQSGLIGLIRYLHQQGIVLLTLYRTRRLTEKENADE